MSLKTHNKSFQQTTYTYADLGVRGVEENHNKMEGMKSKDKEIFNKEQELISFCKKNLDSIPKLQNENLKKYGKINSKEHDEIFTFFSFIQYSIDKPFWSYPVTIIYDDKPDFIIQYNDKKVSLEITGQKATSWRSSLERARRSGVDLGDTYFEDVIEEERVKYTDLEIKQKNQHSAPPSMGNNAEISWIKRTMYTIIKKDKIAEKYPEIKTFSRHILLIFDHCPEAINPNCLSETMFIDLGLYKKCSQTLFERVVCIDSHIIDIDVKNKQFKWLRNPANSIIQKSRVKNQRVSIT